MISGDTSYWLDLAIQKINEWGWSVFIVLPLVIGVLGWLLAVVRRAADGDR